MLFTFVHNGASYRSMCDAAFILRQIFDQGKKKKNVKVAFLDVRKAYDRVWREGLWKKMEGYGFGGKFLLVLKELYKEDTCMVRFGEIETDWFEVKEGLKQVCSLSLVLFALYLAELGDRLVASGLGLGRLRYQDCSLRMIWSSWVKGKDI